MGYLFRCDDCDVEFIIVIDNYTEREVLQTDEPYCPYCGVKSHVEFIRASE